jgi:ECF transporter S component (folate family)
MIALSVILTRVPFLTFYFPGANWLRIGFGSLPIVVSSLVCGPFWGLLVGGASDAIGALLFPAGDYFFGYTIDAALEGFLPWLTMYLLKGRKTGEAISYGLLSAFLVMLSVLFVSLFSSFKKQELYTWARVLIPFGFALFFFAFGLVMFFLRKTKAFKEAQREERRFSLLDIYLIALVNEAVIGVSLHSLWNLMYVSVPYLYSSFAELIIFLVSGTVKTFMIFFIINAVFKAEPTMQIYGLHPKDQMTEKN